ncbi:MAG: LysR family transcriptional regulator substrate-binding protein, partial [Firmicutes bacterium]|nr:LysR family transcriptional regulator substrate-binding protein [Bacillota bacterium]
AHFVAGAGHPLANSGEVTLTEILAEPLILTERGMSYRRSLEVAVAMEELELRPVLEMENTDVIVNLVSHNAGVAYFPEFIIDQHIREGKLAVIPCEIEAESVWSQLVYHRDKLLTPQMKVFMKILQGMKF